MLRRCLLQTLLPGIVSVARMLQFGDGSPTARGPSSPTRSARPSSCSWTGRDKQRPYAAPDLLGALRCRLRRRMLADKARRLELCALPERARETDLDADAFVRALGDAAAAGVTDVDLLYARCVLGYTATELATSIGATTGVLRRRLVAASRSYVDAPS